MARGFIPAALCGLGLLLASSPANGQWLSLPNPTADTLRASHFLDANLGWVAGYNGVVRKTSDGGRSWTAQTSGTSVRLLAIRFVDANVGWINGGLYVARTVDGGARWTPLTIDPSALIFRNFGFASASNVYWVPAACGSCSPPTRWFYRYTVEANGASSEQAFDVVSSSAPLLALHFVDADNGWGVGTGGVIRRINNASTASPSFSFQTSNTGNSLNGIFMLDANTGWIVGNAGTIRATSNGGATWITQTSGTAMNLRDVRFRDASNGYVVGDGGTILSTSNGGSTWVVENSTTTTALFGVATPIGSAYAVGGDLTTSSNGIVLKRTDSVFADGFEARP